MSDSLMRLGATALAISAVLATAHAQTYPTRPVNIVVQLAAGTGMDIVVRLYADKLSQRLGQSVVVENRPGGAGMAAMETLLKAPPDGYTLVAATSSIMAIRPSMFKKPPYDPLADVTPLALYTKSPFIVVVNPALPVKSVPELIAYIKERPGQVSFSSPSIGGAPHLVGEYLKQRYKIELTHVPYRNSPQAIADVAAGHVPMSIAEAGASLPLIRDGKLRALAVTSATRIPTLPDVPSFAEASGIADFEAVSWHVLIIKTATPAEIVNRLHTDMRAIMSAPEMKAAVGRLGLLPQDPPAIDGARAYIKSENEKWGSLVKTLGLAGSI